MSYLHAYGSFFTDVNHLLVVSMTHVTSATSVQTLTFTVSTQSEGKSNLVMKRDGQHKRQTIMILYLHTHW